MLQFRVNDEVMAPVDARLFGQFLERSTFGEVGPECIVDPATGRLPAAVVEKLRAMRIPLIRFPGGSDVDRVDWRDMVDNVPGRPGPRPVTIGNWAKWPTSTPSLALVDLAVTADARSAYVHAINRDMRAALPVGVDLSALGVGDATVVRHRVAPDARGERGALAEGDLCGIVAEPVPIRAGQLTEALPPGSVTIYKAPLAK